MPIVWFSLFATSVISYRPEATSESVIRELNFKSVRKLFFKNIECQKNRYLRIKVIKWEKESSKYGTSGKQC